MGDVEEKFGVDFALLVEQRPADGLDMGGDGVVDVGEFFFDLGEEVENAHLELVEMMNSFGLGSRLEPFIIGIVFVSIC